MNIFQTQLVMADGKSLAEKSSPFKKVVPLAPRPVSIEDFERDTKLTPPQQEKP